MGMCREITGAARQDISLTVYSPTGSTKNCTAHRTISQRACKMALVGSRVQAMQDGDNAMAVRTDVVLDDETGLLLERKTVVAEVLTESGNHKALLVGQQTSVAPIQVNTCYNYDYVTLYNGPHRSLNCAKP